jgi:hypothetical protein
MRSSIAPRGQIEEVGLRLGEPRREAPLLLAEYALSGAHDCERRECGVVAQPSPQAGAQ